MGKTKKKQSQALPKTKKIKSKGKEMFTELKTFEETKIKNQLSLSHYHDHSMEEQDQPEIPLKIINEEPEQENIEQICDVVHRLLAKNKINHKNAFDVPLINIQKLTEFTNTDDNAWKKISSTLESDFKIFSYRVDATHSMAYRILNTMSRNQSDLNPAFSSTKNQQHKHFHHEILDMIDMERVEGSTIQLEKNINNINVEDIEYAYSFNPKLERTKRKFDQTGCKGLLLNNIEIDPNLELSLNGKEKTNPYDYRSNPINVKVDEMHEPLLITSQIEKIRREFCKLTNETTGMTQLNMEDVWKKIGYGIWDDLEMEPEEQPEYMDEEPDNNMRKVEDVVRVGKKRKNGMKVKVISSMDFLRDGDDWLGEFDKRMLGMSDAGGKRNQLKGQRNEDDILFNQEYVDKGDVFTDETIERQKNETELEVEEKHLLPIRMLQKFKIQQIMTLREEPLQNITQPIEEEEYQQYIERTQIDVKRQQMSIRDTKDKMKNLLSKKTHFTNLYHHLEKEQNQISPTLCFLTLLHLANETNLHLQQDTESNFIIN